MSADVAALENASMLARCGVAAEFLTFAKTSFSVVDLNTKLEGQMASATQNLDGCVIGAGFPAYTC